MKFGSLWFGEVALAALSDIAFAYAVGSALFAAWLAQDGARPVVAPSHSAWRRAQHSLVVAAIVLVLADAGWLVYEAATMSGAGLAHAFGAIPTVLTQTHVGAAWCVAFGGALLLVAVALAKPDSPFAHALVVLAVLTVAAGKAAIGHAIDSGVLSAALAVQWLHLLSVTAWGGLVLAGGFTVLPALGSSIARGAMIRTAQRLSKVASIALGFVVATGVLNALRATDGLAAAFGGAWGRVLIAKLVLVLFAVALGALNRFAALPRLARTASTEDAHTFGNVLHLEAYVMIGVFVAAAVLSFMTPVMASGA